MLFFTKASKFLKHGSFKFSVAALILLLITNLILFYNLLYIGYAHDTVSKSQIKQIVLEEQKKEITAPPKKAQEHKCLNSTLIEAYSKKILRLVNVLGEFYRKTPNSTELSKKFDRFRKYFDAEESFSISSSNEDYFTNPQLVKLLKNSILVKATPFLKGSQLKLLLHLSNNTTVIFKPEWQSPYKLIHGSVYSGKDRPHGEVVAFYLSILLNFSRVPVAAMRTLNLKELLLVANRALLNTFISMNNQTCLYGICKSCRRDDLLCTNSSILNGAVMIMLPGKLNLGHRNPWKRTYNCRLLARWETEANYCVSIRYSEYYSNERHIALFFDLIDASIFDFLIDNGDRHHYEYIERNQKLEILFLDNGKSFGNPYVDHIDILAPLFQCCVIRNSTWNTLLHLRGGNLSLWLRRLLKHADPDVILDYRHFQALDRRLLIIFTVIKDCIKHNGMPKVIIDS